MLRSGLAGCKTVCKEGPGLKSQPAACHPSSTPAAELVEHYQRDGFVVVQDLLDAPMRKRMKQVLGQLVDQSRTVSSHTEVYDLEPSHSAAEPRVRRIKKPHLVDAVFKAFIEQPSVLAVMSALLGPSGVRLLNSKLNLKAAEFGSPVEWHQDWAFYPHTNDDVLAVGLMLDDTSEVNGPLLVVPGSHRGPTFDHHDAQGFFCGAMDAKRDGIDAARAVALTGPAGSVSFHHARLVHGSAQNRSAVSRNLLLYEVAAADAFPLRGIGDWDEFNRRLLVGSPLNEPRIVACPVRMPFPPAKHQGSIYESQTALANRYFERVDVPTQASTAPR
jgi:phytanoyl-CoA hydroxylase